MEIVDVVDENDNLIKSIEKTKRLKSDISRSSVIMILNSNEEILLQLRAKNDSSFPNHWDISAGGSVDHGESYLEAANRELFEEIGVKTEIKLISKYLFKPEGERKYFSSYFEGKYDGNFKIDKNEVDSVKYFSIEKIKEMVETKEKFHPECLFILEKYFLKKS